MRYRYGIGPYPLKKVLGTSSDCAVNAFTKLSKSFFLNIIGIINHREKTKIEQTE